MFALCSEIEIGGKKFTSVREVIVKRSIHQPGATATVKVPVTAVLKESGKPPAKTETAQQIKAGDRVTIKLGYDGLLNTEFTGYVKQLNLTAPLEIICEDEFYMTRKKSVTLQGKTTLKEVLQKCGLKTAYCAELAIDDFPAPGKPVAWVLSKLKSKYGLSVWFDLSGQVYACEPYKKVNDAVKYRLRYNVISEDNLKYMHAEDIPVKIKATCIYNDGSKTEAEAGAADGTVKEIYFYNVKDKKELSVLAGAALKQYSYTGYSGKIETFLLPYAAPSFKAVITDEKYAERDGEYFIESVETRFGTSGARRTVEIGIKL